jgi:hypothetical protein
MIRPNPPQYIVEGDSVRIVCIVELDGKKSDLWFLVNRQYAEWISKDNSAPFLLATTPFALRYGHDMKYWADCLKSSCSTSNGS